MADPFDPGRVVWDGRRLVSQFNFSMSDSISKFRTDDTDENSKKIEKSYATSTEGRLQISQSSEPVEDESDSKEDLQVDAVCTDLNVADKRTGAGSVVPSVAPNALQASKHDRSENVLEIVGTSEDHLQMKTPSSETIAKVETRIEEDFQTSVEAIDPSEVVKSRETGKSVLQCAAPDVPQKSGRNSRGHVSVVETSCQLSTQDHILKKMHPSGFVGDGNAKGETESKQDLPVKVEPPEVIRIEELVESVPECLIPEPIHITPRKSNDEDLAMVEKCIRTQDHLQMKPKLSEPMVKDETQVMDQSEMKREPNDSSAVVKEKQTSPDLQECVLADASQISEDEENFEMEEIFAPSEPADEVDLNEVNRMKVETCKEEMSSNAVNQPGPSTLDPGQMTMNGLTTTSAKMSVGQRGEPSTVNPLPINEVPNTNRCGKNQWQDLLVNVKPCKVVCKRLEISRLNRSMSAAKQNGNRNGEECLNIQCDAGITIAERLSEPSKDDSIQSTSNADGNSITEGTQSDQSRHHLKRACRDKTLERCRETIAPLDSESEDSDADDSNAKSSDIEDYDPASPDAEADSSGDSTDCDDENLRTKGSLHIIPAIQELLHGNTLASSHGGGSHKLPEDLLMSILTHEGSEEGLMINLPLLSTMAPFEEVNHGGSTSSAKMSEGQSSESSAQELPPIKASAPNPNGCAKNTQQDLPIKTNVLPNKVLGKRVRMISLLDHSISQANQTWKKYSKECLKIYSDSQESFDVMSRKRKNMTVQIGSHETSQDSRILGGETANARPNELNEEEGPLNLSRADGESVTEGAQSQSPVRSKKACREDSAGSSSDALPCPPGPHECVYCKKPFKSSHDLLLHIIRHHRTARQVTCVVCGIVKSTVRKLKEHSYSHTNKYPYRCDRCDKGLATKGLLEAHIRKAHTGEKPFKCNVCGKAYLNKSSLFTHKQYHDEPFLCATCGKPFPRKGDLEEHEATHGEKKFTCSACTQSFHRERAMWTHYKRVHGQDTSLNRTLCHICGKSVSRGAYQSHVDQHSDHRPYACKMCEKTFKTENTLLVHEKTHTGQRPYSCETCGETFTQISSLLRHKNTHSGVRPFSCDLCGKSFTQTNSLVRHKRSHTGERPFKCDKCGKSFIERYPLTVHMKKHKEDQ